jgi:hypothetical protein
MGNKKAALHTAFLAIVKRLRGTKKPPSRRLCLPLTRAIRVISVPLWAGFGTLQEEPKGCRAGHRARSLAALSIASISYLFFNVMMHYTMNTREKASFRLEGLF